ncbi:MAG: hypothetical protein IJU20_05660 [Clostridia bacterium]|nr:hypothetical protein [Clostridia bacterium]
MAKTNKNQKKTRTKQQTTTRIVCLVLAILLAAGTAGIILSIIFSH